MVYYYKDLAFDTHPMVYAPKEDSELLAGNIQAAKGDYVLDMGCGSGIQAIVAFSKARRVLAVDINPQAIDTARLNAEKNKARNIEYRISNLFENIKEEEKFDLIIFNPPYIPSEEKDMQARAWAGGIMGREIIDRFIEDAPKHLTEKGRIQLLVSSLNDLDGILKAMQKKNLEVKVIASEKLWFEELYVVLAKIKKI